jgi:hypothetical protein
MGIAELYSKKQPLDRVPGQHRMVQPIVIRPLATSLPYTTWLNWRKLVFSKRGAMLCKSATISVIGFSGKLMFW